MPAAAVIQEGQALFGMIWSKTSVGGLKRLMVKGFLPKKTKLSKPLNWELKRGK